jgi:hypothetical protein
MKIKLQDGQVIENLTLNGNNYISKKIIDSSIFENNLERVEIIDEEITQVYYNMKLVQNIVYNNESWFVLAEKSENDLLKERLVQMEELALAQGGVI